jgi:hypothetical protein
LKKQLALSIALATTSIAFASEFDTFIEETTIDLKVRSALIKMNPNDVKYEKQYDAGTAATILLSSGDYTFGTDVATAAGNIIGSGQLSAVNAGINANLKETVEKAGKLDQAGSSIWVQMESGYLYDIVGFDLGYQAALKHFKEDESEKLIIASQDDDSYTRLSTARIKLKYGNEDLYVKANYGRYSDADETDYLMDSTDEGYGASAHFKDWSLSYDAVTASAGKTESDLTELDTKKETIALDYSSNFGKASATREYMTDIENTDSYSAASGIPLSMLGLNISQERLMDYLLIAQVDYATKTVDADTSLETTQYEIMLALKLNGLTLAASYNKADKDSGAGVENLVDKALLNSYDMAGQSTMTYAASLDGAMFKVPGLSLSAVMLDSKIADITKTPFTYQLTGDKAFTETLVDASYAFGEDTVLKGLALRAVFGNETNQANVSGYGVFVDYNLSF